MITSHEMYMKEALLEASKAEKKGEIPIGAIIVQNGDIISRGHNTKEETKKVFRHAEINAIELASNVLDNWHLNDAVMYVTVEPCMMCASAIIDSRIKTVYYGAKEPKTGAHMSKIMIFDLPNQHKVDVYGGILQEESENILKNFFKKRRN